MAVVLHGDAWLAAVALSLVYSALLRPDQELVDVVEREGEARDSCRPCLTVLQLKTLLGGGGGGGGVRARTV